MSHLATRGPALSIPEAWTDDWTAADRMPGPGPEWLESLRREAATRFNELGLPTLRHEEWRYTSLEGLRRTPLALRPGPGPGAVDTDSAPRPAPLEGCRLVFVNGRYDPARSTPEPPGAGAVVLTLAEALERDEPGLAEHLGRCGGELDDAFAALNTALADSGVVVFVPEGAAVEMPVHVVNLVAGLPGPVAFHPRVLVVAGRSSRVSVVEEYLGAGEGVYLTNALTEVRVGPGADVRHYLVEREGPAAFNVSTLKVLQERDSRFESHSVLLGGRLVRNNVNPVLDGEGCHSLLNGLYVGAGAQVLDNHMRVVHAKAHCDSRQYYKGILDGESHGIFSGRIVVVEDAQKTDAVQSNQSLLLSDRAQAQAKPQLEIYADDVKCTHGATIGQLDENAIFYLRTRGLPLPEARRMLVGSFAGESLDRITLEPLREHLRALVAERLSSA